MITIPLRFHAGGGDAARLGIVLAAGFFCLQTFGAIPFTVQGPGVNSNDFRVTVFASSLDFPLGMAKLPDGSLLVGVCQGANFFNSTGSFCGLSTPMMMASRMGRGACFLQDCQERRPPFALREALF